MWGPDMKEMNAQPINFRAELAKRIQPRLTPPPVIMMPPMIDQCAHLVQRGPLAPILNQFRLWPARMINPSVQILQRAFRRIEDKGRNGIRHVSVSMAISGHQTPRRGPAQYFCAFLIWTFANLRRIGNPHMHTQPALLLRLTRP